MKKDSVPPTMSMIKPNRIHTLAITTVLVFSPQLLAFTQQNPRNSEQITITTYYPSPDGMYNQLSVGNGGLKLGKAVDNVPANTWTDIDAIPSRSAGLFIVTIVPKQEDFVSTSLILFSADGKNVGLELIGVPAISNAYEKKEQFKEPTNIAQFRAQRSNGQELFILQVMPVKECRVYIGKTLTYQ